jgi:hypothetical protein
MDRIKNILNIFIKKSLPDCKFSKGDLVEISAGIYHDLYGCRGTIKKIRENGIYYVSLLYPSEYQLKEFDGEFIPCWFDESELEFVNKNDERDYKLNKLLYG